jgi:hypothetical protein
MGTLYRDRGFLALMKSKTRTAASEKQVRAVQKFFPNVQNVEDGRDDVLVEVTSRDVAWAARKNHNHCALARACEKMVGVDGAIISRVCAYLIAGSTAIRYHLSTAAAREIMAFDRGAGFAPGEYLLKAVPKSNRFGVRSPKAGRPSKAPKERRRWHLTKGLRSSMAGHSK